MSYIPCISTCVYQQDGYCHLEQSASCGVLGSESDCLYFVPKEAIHSDITSTKSQAHPLHV